MTYRNDFNMVTCNHMLMRMADLIMMWPWDLEGHDIRFLSDNFKTT